MIQIVWGNKICVFSKRINKKNIYDKKLDIYEKCCTFDGYDHYSENGKNPLNDSKKAYITLFYSACKRPPFKIFTC